MADPSGSIPSSSAARAWNSRVYSTTGGQTVATRGSETPVAQPLRGPGANQIRPLTAIANRDGPSRLCCWASALPRRPPGPHRVTPLDPLQQIAELRCTDGYRPARRRRPGKPSPFQTLARPSCLIRDAACAPAAAQPPIRRTPWVFLTPVGQLVVCPSSYRNRPDSICRRFAALPVAVFSRRTVMIPDPHSRYPSASSPP